MDPRAPGNRYPDRVRHFDLILIGTGSGNSIVGPQFDGWKVAILEKGLFGGTCLNVGCIPTKMYVYPAELAQGAVEAGPLGVDAHLDKVHWSAIRDRIFGRIDAIEAGGRDYRTGDRTPNTTVYTGTARFIGPKVLDTGTGETITADRIVVAAGGRVDVPAIPGLASVPFETSDTVMRIDDLPASIVIIGGGYIAAEFAHVFASFGTRVTQLVRGPRLLRRHDVEIGQAFTESASARYDVRLNATITGVSGGSSGISVNVTGPLGTDTVTAEVLLVATGRRPNSDLLDAAAGGLELHPDGRIVVDSYQRTSVDGVYALGDISSDWALKHVANAEARTVAHNLEHPNDLVATDHRFVPAAVFTHPQIAAVGLTEEEAFESGLDYVVARQKYGDIAAGWAREDTAGFAKLIAETATGKILGAHIIGPEAATVIQPLIQAMSFGQTAYELARGQYWIHPALTEVVENAVLGLPLRARKPDNS